jgi:phosphate starvation-inducible PhoH-like protein
VGDGVLDALRARCRARCACAGNQLTIEGEDGQRRRRPSGSSTSSSSSSREARRSSAGTVDAIVSAIDQAEDVHEIFADVVWSHRGKQITPKTSRRSATSTRSASALSPSASAPPAPARRTWRSRSRLQRCPSARSAGSSSRAPAVEAGERLGFLRRCLAKVDPYMRPLFDALYDTMTRRSSTPSWSAAPSRSAPLAFMRGRTLNDSFVILDEAQNTSPEQMQMFLTRLGFGSKVVVTGDVTQVDLPRDQASGLIQVRDILSAIDGSAFVEFTHQDVVRHKLVQRIVEAYKLHAEETGTARKR